VNRIVGAASIRRMGDIEMMSDLLIGLLHGPQGGSAKVLNEYYEEYEEFDDDEFPDQTRFRRLFDQTLATIQRLFPHISETPRWGNRADFYSLFIAIGHLLKDHRIPKSSERQLSRKLVNFAEEVDRRIETPTARTSAAARSYARAIEKGSNDKARRTDRHEALINLLSPFVRRKQ
jgi:hypothetical protein